PPKFYVVELAMYVPLAWILIARYGLVGAAWGTCMRIALDGVLLFGAAWKLYPASWARLARDAALGRLIVALGGLSVASVLVRNTAAQPVVQTSAIAGLFAAFAAAVWYGVLDSDERHRL